MSLSTTLLTPFSSKRRVAELILPQAAAEKNQDRTSTDAWKNSAVVFATEAVDVETPSRDNLSMLPETVLLTHILPCLEATDLSRVARLNKRFYAISYHPFVWRAIYVRDFLAPLCAREALGPEPARDGRGGAAGEPVVLEPISELTNDFTSQNISVRRAYIERVIQSKQRRSHREMLRRFKTYDERVETVRYRLGVLFAALEDADGNWSALCACLAVFFSLLGYYLLPESRMSAATLMAPWWIFLAYLYAGAATGVLLIRFEERADRFPNVYLHGFWRSNDGFFEFFMYNLCGLKFTKEGNEETRIICGAALYFALITCVASFLVILPLKIEGSLADASWSLAFIPWYVFCLILLLIPFVHTHESVQDAVEAVAWQLLLLVGPLATQILLLHLRCLAVITSSLSVLLIPFFVFETLFLLTVLVLHLEVSEDGCFIAVAKWLRDLVFLAGPAVATQVMLVSYVDSGGDASSYRSTTVFLPVIPVFSLMAVRFAYCCSFYSHISTIAYPLERPSEFDPITSKRLRVSRRRSIDSSCLDEGAKERQMQNV